MLALDSGCFEAFKYVSLLHWRRGLKTGESAGVASREREKNETLVGGRRCNTGRSRAGKAQLPSLQFPRELFDAVSDAMWVNVVQKL